MKWITREQVKVDRVACPWLIKKFVDKEAEFHFVPADKVQSEAARLGAIPYDVPNAELGHHGKECSFDAIVKKYGLTGDPALAEDIVQEVSLKAIQGQHTFRPDADFKPWVFSILLNELGPCSVLDVGANTGQYSRLAAAQGRRVTACDLDTAALTRCYEQACTEKLNVLPLAVNVFSDSPSPGRGGVPCPPPAQRLRSEPVMGLALIHHVVAMQRLPIQRIVEVLAAMSERWLLLEFVPPLKARVGASPVAGLDDYTANQLERCLKKSFNRVTPLPSYPAERQLFVCAR